MGRERVRNAAAYKENLTTNCANTIYKSFILSIMDYCDSVWACCGKGNANLLEKLQRRAAWTVMRSDSSDMALSNLRWSSLETRRDSHVFNLVRKCF